MARLLVTDIEWDLDNDDPDLDPTGLPDQIELTVDDDYDPDYEPAETLTRMYGFCIRALEVERID